MCCTLWIPTILSWYCSVSTGRYSPAPLASAALVVVATINNLFAALDDNVLKKLLTDDNDKRVADATILYKLA